MWYTGMYVVELGVLERVGRVVEGEEECRGEEKDE